MVEKMLAIGKNKNKTQKVFKNMVDQMLAMDKEPVIKKDPVVKKEPAVIKKEPVVKKEPVFNIPSNTPADIQQLSKEIAKLIDQKKPVTPEKLDSLIKSYSPSINNQLEKFESTAMTQTAKLDVLPFETQREQMFDCLIKEDFVNVDQKEKAEEKAEAKAKEGDEKSKPKPNSITYYHKKANPQIYLNDNCISVVNTKAIKFLLKSLDYSIKNIDVDKLITPLQVESNCWFNTFFVVFFLSDKGRKFSKALRHFMVTQKAPGSTQTIPSAKMRKTLMRFNLAIEASLVGHPIAYKLNTNSIFTSVVQSIPSQFKKIKSAMPKYKKAANPLVFYVNLMTYFKRNFGVTGIKTASIKLREPKDNLDEESQKYIVEQGYDLVFIEVYDQSSDRKYNKSKELKKPLKMSSGNMEYTLGGVIIRDTQKRHFCCACDINGKEYGFDGASFTRLSKFKWRRKLNTNAMWSFHGSVWQQAAGASVAAEDSMGEGGAKAGGAADSMGGAKKIVIGDPIMWNFMNGYQILFYYRTK